VLQARLFD